MKSKLKLSPITLLFLCLSCEKLPEIDPCRSLAPFDIVDLQEPCPSPCKLTIIPPELEDFSSFLWLLNNDSTLTTTERFEYILDDPGSYNIVLTAFSENCEPRVFSQTITVGLPPPVASFSADTNRCTLVREICEINFTNTSRNARQFEWWVNDTMQDTTTNFSYHFQEADTFVVTLKAINAAMDTAETSQNIVIRPLTLGIRTYNIDNNPLQEEAIYGIDEKPGNQGYFLIMNNMKACYLAHTDVFGELGSTEGPRNLGTTYSGMQVNDFTKTTSGYFLAGRALKPQTDQDIFVFGATPAYSIMGLRSYFESGTGFNEDAFGITASKDGNVVIAGRGSLFDFIQFQNKGGVYLAQITIDFSTKQENPKVLIGSNSPPFAKGEAIVNVSEGYWLAGIGPDGNAFFARVKDDFTLNGDLLALGADDFTAEKIIPIDDDSAIIIGIKGFSAYAYKITDMAAAARIDWEEPYPGWKFTNGLMTDRGRLVLIGANINNNLPAWFEIDPVSGKRLSNDQSYSSPEIEIGELQTIVQTQDGGFLMGGSGRKSLGTDFSILLKTDKNGIID